jgi:hypothetical protein
MAQRNRIVLLAAVAAAAGAVATATPGTAQEPGDQVLKLVERPGAGDIVDNPPKQLRPSTPRFSPGDLTVGTAPIYDEANTRRLGTLHLECIATRGGLRGVRAKFHCNGTFELQDGTLAVDFAGGSESTITLAVTGGTGAYAGRDGTDVSVENGDIANHTIRLRP